MALTVSQIREKLNGADGEALRDLERLYGADGRKGVKEALRAARKRLEASEREAGRLEALYAHDASFTEGRAHALVAGLDEVGRGSVAGPLAVGAVVLPDEPRIEGLNDSKQIPPKMREVVAQDIRNVALWSSVFFVEPADIDAEGMAASLRRAFKGALEDIERQGAAPDVVLVDGNPLGIDPRERSIVKGDAKSAAIAAASIIAKVARDDLMRSLDSTFPQYGFSRNVGYASPEHIEAIKTHGLSPVHRASFCKSFMQEALF